MSDKVNETQTMIAIGILLIMLAVLWYFYQSDIAWLVGQTRLAYLWVFHFFTDHFERIRVWLLNAPVDSRLPPEQRLKWDDIVIVSALIGNYMRWPTALFMVYGIYWAMYKTPRRQYRTKYNLASLMQIQSKIWPVIAPIVNFNPAAVSSRVPGQPVQEKLPPFAESLSPEEWIAWDRIPMRDGAPDREAVRQALIKQLGPKWEGLKGLKPYHRALIAAFALKGAQKRTESEELLGHIAQCWDVKTGLKLVPEVAKRVDKVLNDKKLLQPAVEAAQNFAYRTTAMLAILRWARDQGGVLAPAQFLWLRGEDRALWYPLNNLGRRSYHSEAAGAMAHFMAESMARHALPMARVDNAITTFMDYMKENPTAIPALEGGPRDTARLKMS